VAIPAVDAEARGVVVVAERDRLGVDVVFTRHITRVGEDPAEIPQSSEEEDPAEHRKSRESVRAPMK
jgi:hypothetical protein